MREELNNIVDEIFSEYGEDRNVIVFDCAHYDSNKEKMIGCDPYDSIEFENCSYDILKPIIASMNSYEEYMKFRSKLQKLRDILENLKCPAAAKIFKEKLDMADEEIYGCLGVTKNHVIVSFYIESDGTFNEEDESNLYIMQLENV